MIKFLFLKHHCGAADIRGPNGGWQGGGGALVWI